MLVCLFALAASGCASNVGPYWQNVWFVNPIDPARHDYTVLGTVTVEREWLGVLGMNIPFFGGGWIFQRGGITHAEVLEEARRQHPTADAVIGINVSSNTTGFGPFFATRRLTANGIVIRYAEEQRNARRSED